MSLEALGDNVHVLLSRVRIGRVHKVRVTWKANGKTHAAYGDTVREALAEAAKQ